jgi:hypothetical protein
MDQIKLGATIVKKFTITNSAGNLADPDGVAVLPVGVLSKNGIATAVTVTVTKVTTGDYYATFSILAADGFAANNIAELAITATIDTLDKKVIIGELGNLSGVVQKEVDKKLRALLML